MNEPSAARSPDGNSGKLPLRGHFCAAALPPRVAFRSRRFGGDRVSNAGTCAVCLRSFTLSRRVEDHEGTILGNTLSAGRKKLRSGEGGSRS